MKWTLPLGAMLALTLVGCARGGFSRRAAATNTNVFTYPIPAKPTTMDPGKVQDGDTIDIIQQAYEGLVGWNEQNQIEPRLATSWTVSPDGTVYTFKLRKGVKFHNGREVKADDFKWVIERNANPNFTSATVATYLTDIVGVKERLAGKAPEVRGVRALDPYTLQIQIDKPRPYFLGKLTYPVAFVFAKEALADPTKEITQVSEMVGTGPFRFETVNVDTQVTLVPFRDYYEGAPKIERMVRPYVGDPATRLQMYKNGRLDLLQLERQDVPSLQNDPKYKNQVYFYDRPSLWYVGIHNTLIPAMRDPRVRRAIAIAIDKNKIVNEILGGINRRADGIVPPGVFGYQPNVKGVPYDPAGARRLLAQAGYPNGRGIPDLTIYIRNNRPDISIVAEAVGAQLKSALGLNVSVRPMEWGAFLEKNNRKELPFVHMRWAADYLDAENFLSTLLASYGAENKLGYSNPQFDALTQRADTSSDPSERLRLYNRAEEIALRDATIIPIYFQRDVELISPRVKGIRNSLFGHLPHSKVTLGP